MRSCPPANWSSLTKRSVKKGSYPESEQVRVGLESPQKGDSIEGADVVLTDHYDGIAPRHHLEYFFVAEHLVLRGEHGSLGHHLADDPDQCWSLGENVGEDPLPQRDRRGRGATVEVDDCEPPFVHRTPHVDSFLLVERVEVTLQHRVG